MASRTMTDGPSVVRPRHRKTLSALLSPFDHSKNDGKIPSASRAGADIAEQKTANQISLFESWKYLPFLAHQATVLTSAFVSHHVFGPPKKSWGIEMTLLTTAIRESVHYSHLSNLDMLRRVLNLGQILPTPRDGVVTPVTFIVRRRGLHGLLADADAKETGRREITGEWVVSKRMWKRMQLEHYGYGFSSSASSRRVSHAARHPSSLPMSRHSSGRSSTLRARPHSAVPTTASLHRSSSQHFSKDKVVLYLHGGAYYTMSAATHRHVTISMSKYTDCRVFAVNYRLAPECRWPGQIHDAVSAWLRLTMDLRIPPENIIIAGDSAGGGLTLALMMYLRDNGYDLPCASVLMSPWVDLTMSCDSWETNARYDYLRMPSGDDHMNPIASYLGASNVKSLITNPYVSPLFGNFEGLPPLLIQCGDAECLRDEGTLLAHKASLAGVQVFHEVYEDCPHVFQALFFLEATKKAFRSHRHFVKRILPALVRNTTMDVDALDEELLHDAHAIRRDGSAAPESLPASPEQIIAELDSEVSADQGENIEDSDEVTMQTDTDRNVPTAELDRDLPSANNTLQADVADATLSMVSSLISSAAAASGRSNHDLGSVHFEQDRDIEDASHGDVRGQTTSMSRAYSRKGQSHHSLSVPSSPRISRTQSRRRSITALSSPSHAFTALHPDNNDEEAHNLEQIRRDLRPKARAGSHPDLVALVNSYDQTPMECKTVLWRTDEL